MVGALIYIFEFSIALGVCLAVYRLLLSKLTFFSWSRFYLLLSVFFSASLPLIPFPTFFSIPNLVEYSLPEFVTGGGSIDSGIQDYFSISNLILIGYLTGVLVVFIRYFKEWIAIYGLIKKGRKIYQEEFKLIIHPSSRPSSFFSYILLPDFLENDPLFDQVLLHEKMHVKLKHSWDLVFMNIAKGIFWFNPLIYLFENYLREVHEYQADQGVTRKFSVKGYASLLLEILKIGTESQMASGFEGSQTKKRIMMLAKGHSNPKFKWRFLVGVPVISVLLLFFSCEHDLDESFSSQVQQVIREEGVQLNELPPPQPPFKAQPVSDEVFDIVENQPKPPGGTMESWNSYLNENLVYPERARILGVEGTVILVFVIYEDGSVHDVEILRGIGGGADEEAVRVVSASPNWEPGKQRGRVVKTRMRLPIRFKL